MHFLKILLLCQKYKRKFCQKNNDLFFVILSILGTYWFQGHVDEIIPQLCRKRHTLNPELISNKCYQCDAAALFSELSLADCSWSISLITADLLQGEEEDPQDLCALRNLNKNTLAGASSHLQWSCVWRAGLRALHWREQLCVLFVCSSSLPKSWSKPKAAPVIPARLCRILRSPETVWSVLGY